MPTDKLLLNIDRIIKILIMALEDRDIIQVDATVIVGVFIFLSQTLLDSKVHQFKFLSH
jgi:hypothetical protein